MLEGELGTLNRDGRQVGGFLNWQMSAMLDGMPRSGCRTFERKTFKVTVGKYWILEELEGDEFHADFYQLIKDRLIIVTRHDVTVKIPDSPLNMIIPGHLVMWHG